MNKHLIAATIALLLFAPAPPAAAAGAPGWSSGSGSGGPDREDGPYAGRRDDRARFLRENGGSMATESALTAALDWLARHQHPDGHWSVREFSAKCEGRACPDAGAESAGDTGLTGLALLALLGAGHTHREGAYAANARRACYWLQEQQDADGCITNQPTRQPPLMYNHGIATLALAELCAMTGDGEVGRAAQQAIDFTAEAQSRETGGWGYRPGESGNTSVTGWQILAHYAAENARLDLPLGVISGANRWFQSVTAGEDGLAGYTAAEPRLSATAISLVCARIMQIPPDHPFLARNADRLLEHRPDWDGRAALDEDEGFYFWFFATQAMFHQGGRHWEEWNRAMMDTLLGAQENGGCARGSWTGADCAQGGRVMTTALGALILETYYRETRLGEDWPDEPPPERPIEPVRPPKPTPTPVEARQPPPSPAPAGTAEELYERARTAAAAARRTGDRAKRQEALDCCEQALRINRDPQLGRDLRSLRARLRRELSSD